MNVEVVPLRELCHVRIGRTPSRRAPKYWGGSGVWVTISELDGGVVTDSKEHISAVAIQEVMPPPVPPGTLLFSFKLSIGKMAVAGVPLYTNEAIAALAIKDPGRLDREYLRYALMATSSRAQTNHAVLGKVLNKAKVEALPIPWIPLHEQRRIVDLLSRADNIVRMRQDAEAKTSELIPTIFLDMFGDPATHLRGDPCTSPQSRIPVVTLGEIADSVNYGTSVKAEPEGGGVPVIRMCNVDYAGRALLADIKYVLLSETEYAKQRLEAGDIIFNRTNSRDLVGKTGIWRAPFDAVAASYFIRLRLNTSRVESNYIWAFMNTHFMKRALFELARGAIGQANINARELLSIRIPLPPLAAQKKFSLVVARCVRLEEQAAMATTHGKRIFASMLAGAFRT